MQALEQDFVKYGLVEAIMEPLAKVTCLGELFVAITHKQLCVIAQACFLSLVQCETDGHYSAAACLVRC